jgi:antitoxin FitA
MRKAKRGCRSNLRLPGVGGGHFLPVASCLEILVARRTPRPSALARSKHTGGRRRPPLHDSPCRPLRPAPPLPPLVQSMIAMLSLPIVASITIRRLPENTKRRLRIRAARNGRSMEQEARELLEAALARPESEFENIGEAIHRIFAPLGGVDLRIPPRRGAIREIRFK